MNSRLVISSLLFATSVLALAGIGTLPVSVNQTNLQPLTSTRLYYLAGTRIYTTTSTASMPPSIFQAVWEGELTNDNGTLECALNPYGSYEFCSLFSYLDTNGTYPIATFTTQATYMAPGTSYVPYTITQTSIGLVPASEAIGLSQREFIALSVIVIGALGFIVAWTINKKPRE